MTRFLKSMCALFVTIMVLFFSTATVQAGSSNDISFWHKYTEGGRYTSIPWFVHADENFYAEYRQNFDWGNTSSAFIGKMMSVSDDWYAIPNVGIMFGNYHGWSPQMYIGSGDDQSPNKFFSLWQYTSSTNDLPSFAYFWAEDLVKVSTNVRFGMGAQFYDEEGLDSSVDLGPTVKLLLGSYYIKPWLTWSPTDDGAVKSFVGMGAVF